MRVFNSSPNGNFLTIGNRDHETGPINIERFELESGWNDVPDAFWDRWVSENRDYGPFKAGLFYAVPEPKPGDEPAPAPIARPFQSAAFDPAAPAPTIERNCFEVVADDTTVHSGEPI